jgi:ATP-dependent DNA ligase
LPAGFVPHLRREVFRALKPRHIDQCPFADLPNPKSSRWGGGVTAGEMRKMQWVRPELVAQVRFVEWTSEGRLRHAAFLGLRSDKSAREVRREANEVTSSLSQFGHSGRTDDPVIFCTTTQVLCLAARKKVRLNYG